MGYRLGRRILDTQHVPQHDNITLMPTDGWIDISGQSYRVWVDTTDGKTYAIYELFGERKVHRVYNERTNT